MLAGLALVSFTVAAGFVWIGLWPVLPFAGLEMLVVSAVLYHCALRARHCEMVTITDDAIEVAAGRQRAERRVSFSRPWARVILAPPVFRGYPRRLLIRAYGREVEIGVCLTDQERTELAQALQKIV